MTTGELEQKCNDLEQRVSRIELAIRKENKRRRKFRRDIQNLNPANPLRVHSRCE
jgi:predicted  nucleic acid-binding Zn-ribbon protein